MELVPRARDRVEEELPLALRVVVPGEKTPREGIALVCPERTREGAARPVVEQEVAPPGARERALGEPADDRDARAPRARLGHVDDVHDEAPPVARRVLALPRLGLDPGDEGRAVLDHVPGEEPGELAQERVERLEGRDLVRRRLDRRLVGDERELGEERAARASP